MPFKPGQSGNPGGRPKEYDEIKDLAKQHTVLAIEKLVSWAKSKNPKASVSACIALLDRAWGRPTQTLAGDKENPLQVGLLKWKDEA